jgi:hypothetical protein
MGRSGSSPGVVGGRWRWSRKVEAGQVGWRQNSWRPVLVRNLQEEGRTVVVLVLIPGGPLSFNDEVDGYRMLQVKWWKVRVRSRGEEEE